MVAGYKAAHRPGTGLRAATTWRQRIRICAKLSTGRTHFGSCDCVYRHFPLMWWMGAAKPWLAGCFPVRCLYVGLYWAGCAQIMPFMLRPVNKRQCLSLKIVACFETVEATLKNVLLHTTVQDLPFSSRRTCCLSRAIKTAYCLSYT